MATPPDEDPATEALFPLLDAYVEGLHRGAPRRDDILGARPELTPVLDVLDSVHCLAPAGPSGGPAANADEATQDWTGDSAPAASLAPGHLPRDFGRYELL